MNPIFAQRRGYFFDEIENALWNLRQMHRYQTGAGIRECLEWAQRHLRCALGWANRLKDSELRAVSMRLLGWLAAALRRAV